MALLLTWEVNTETKNPTIKLILENLLKIAVLEMNILFFTKSSTFRFTSIYTSVFSILSGDTCEPCTATSPALDPWVRSAVQSSVILKSDHIWAGDVYRE